MSASPPGNPNGRAQTPKLPPPQFLRKKRPADPLVPRKKQPQRPPSALPGPTALRKPNPNGIPPAGTVSQGQRPFQASPAPVSGYNQAHFDNLRRQHGGWTEPPSGASYVDYPLMTTKRELREGLRFHVMRLIRSKVGEGEKPVDPTDQSDFTRPVSLHRRDPRQPPLGRVVAPKEETTASAPIDEKEAERLAQLKLEREAQRAIDLAQIAPVNKDPNPKRNAHANRPEKTTQVYAQNRTEEQKKESELRYEEALPWHIEDADGKNVWVGSYVSALSEANVALVVDNNTSSFRMIPLEKWYRFTAKPPFNPYSIEEAEALMNKKVDVGRWVMRDKEKAAEKLQMEDTRKFFSGPVKVKKESNTFKAASRSEKVDHDDVDMSGDEFQDDDENPGFDADNDEDTRDAKDRIRREQLGANLFGDADEKEVEKELEDERKEELARKLLGKQMKKALTRRENALIYESDSSNSDPFASSSSEDESESERQKKEEEAKNNLKADGKDREKEKEKEREKGASGSSTKGTTTPQGKAKPDALKKGKSLKRPGSPNLSESSGNESSRKKARKQAIASGQGSRATTPLPPSQAAASQGSRAKGAGFMSDGEGTAGEMSDGGKIKKKIKIIGTGAKNSPTGSRAGSPVPSLLAAQLAPGSNPASPSKGGVSSPRAGSPSGIVEASEILQALPQPPNGITIGNLMKAFMPRVGDGPGQMLRKDWIKLVKENSVYGSDKLLRRKP